MVVFKVGDHDFSSNVVGNNYKIHDVDVFTSWTDANYVTHREKVRTRISGTFDMLFETAIDYEIFSRTMESLKNRDLSYPITIKENTLNELREINAYVNWKPTRAINSLWQDYFAVFSVSVEER